MSNSTLGVERPNYFIQNTGQVVNQTGVKNLDVLFLLNTPGLKVQLKKDGFSYDFYTKKNRDSISKLVSTLYPDSLNYEPSVYDFHRLDVRFLDCNDDFAIQTFDEGPLRFAYSDDSEVQQKIKSFKRILYHNVYDNVDIEFQIPNEPDKPVEYNFIIHPKGRISDIKMKFSGAVAELGEDHLMFSLSMGKMKETIPMSWIESNGNSVKADVAFMSQGENIFGFKTTIGNGLTSNEKLVIDPTPVRLWATYYGGEADEAQYDASLATDSNGNVFISGYTRSFNNIATTGSYQNTYTNDSQNGYLAKFHPDGTLEWATYYGERRTLFRSIAIDENDNIIGVGNTYSIGGIGTAGAHQEQLYNATDNYSDGFIVKFDTNGNRLWGTYFGGESTEYCTGISVDANNNIYVSGHTASNENIATPGAFRNTGELNVHNNWDPFLFKMNSNGTLLWSTYYGGQYGTGVDVDSGGNVYLVGSAQSYPDENIATPGSYQETYSDEGSLSWSDTFLVKFDTNGNRLWGTYYGGDSYDDPNDVVVDQNDNVIICGSTRSNVFPTTENAHQRVKTAGYNDYNAFLAKFNAGGTIIWNTLYGGEQTTMGLGVAVDANNNVFLTGGTLSFNDISTPDSFQETRDNSNISNSWARSAYLVKFDEAGARQWGTYYGGIYFDEGQNVKIDNIGDIYLLGHTFGSTTLATAGSHQESYDGAIDNFLVKFRDCESTIITEVPEGVCEGDTIYLEASGGIAYEWSGPNGFSSTDAYVEIANATLANNGVYSLQITTVTGCDDTRTFEINVSTKPTVGQLEDLYACAESVGSNFASTFDTSSIHQLALDNQTGVEVTYFGGSGTILPSPLPNPMSNTTPGNETIIVRVSDINNPDCYVETSFNLVVRDSPEIHPLEDIFQCDDDHDGYTTFDISNIETLLIGNQMDLQLLVSDESGNILPSPLPSAYINSVSNQETLNVKVINTNTGCFSETTLRLFVAETPIAHEVMTLFGCDEDNDGISESFDTSSVVYQVLDGQEGLEVSFLDENGNEMMSELPNPFTNTTPDEQTLTIRITDPVSGCFDETDLIIKAVSQPQVDVPNELYSCSDEGGIGFFDIKSLSEEILYNKVGYKLTVRDGNNTIIANDLTAYQSKGETISIIVEDVNNPTCFKEFTLNLVVNGFFAIELEDSYAICALDPNIQLQLPSQYQMVEWYDENDNLVSSDTMATLSNEGTYMVLATSIQNGMTCTYIHEFNVVRSDLPTIEEVKVDEFGATSIEIMAVGDGDFEYSIDGLNYQDSNFFEIIEGGIYTVHVRDKNYCGEDSITVTVLNYPKFFTPNNDGVNDTWKLQGIEEFSNAYLYIYDRYGKLLVQLNGQYEWNGEYNGHPMPKSDYWFKIDVSNGKSFSGHFSLIR